MLHIRTDSAVPSLREKLTSFNTLLVAARDFSRGSLLYEDVDPFLTLNVLSHVREIVAKHARGFRLSIEMVRPPTFEALKERLGPTES